MFARATAILPALALLGAAPSAPVERTAASRNILAACGTRDGWSDPAPPAHIHGRSWYVGTCGITAVLIETRAGLVLIDTGPADAAQHVLANIRALGFAPRQVKWLLMTHEHFDHVGGMAAIQQATGARLATLRAAAEVLRSGRPNPADPQYGLLIGQPMAPARVHRELRHGEALVLGGMRFTVHANPTHSPGSSSWTWRSCEADKCLTIAYVDSISSISSDDYRFSDHPERVEAARAGLRVMESLPCDLMLTPHPDGSALLERLSGKQPLTGPRACVAYADQGGQRLANRLASETAAR